MNNKKLFMIVFFKQRVKNKSLEDVVMLNVDTNTLESPFNDLSNLPVDVVSLKAFWQAYIFSWTLKLLSYFSHFYLK